jgi:uncharacterized protein
MTPLIRSAGEFCWINLLSTDPAAARQFFGALLHWTFDEMPGMGHLVRAGGEPFAGLFDVNAPGAPPGMKPMIGVMIKVDDADATCARIAQLGGSHQPPFDIGTNLRMAVCHDPNGAKFDLFQPLTQKETTVDGRVHGAPCWFETITSDTARAGAFYEALFGWTPTTQQFHWGTYTTYSRAGAPVAGMMPLLAEMAPMTSHWGVYFMVRDIEESAKLAPTLGGNVFLPITPIPGVGRFCGVGTPEGLAFYLLQQP